MYATKSVTAQNSFTNPVRVEGDFNISISGTWAGTVTLQRSFDDGSTWVDVNSWTANFEGRDTEPVRAELNGTVTKYRLGIKTGDFSSGTAVCRVGA